jgi:hypothetical protein
MTPHELATKIAATFGVPLDDILHGRGGYDRKVRAMIRTEIIYQVYINSKPLRFHDWLQSVKIEPSNANAVMRQRATSINHYAMGKIEYKIATIAASAANGLTPPKSMVQQVELALI